MLDDESDSYKEQLGREDEPGRLMRASGPGRPAISKMSWTIFVDTARNTVINFDFGKAAYFDDYVAEVEVELQIMAEAAKRSPLIIKLKDGESSIEGLLSITGLSRGTMSSLVTEEAGKKKKAMNAKLSEMPNPIRDLLVESMTRRPPTMISEISTRQTPLAISVVQMRIEGKLKLKDIAMKTKLSISTISRLLTSYESDPVSFYNKYANIDTEATVFMEGTKEAIKVATERGDCCFTNMASACSFLKEFMDGRQQLSNKKIMQAAKDELSFVRLTPKIHKVAFKEYRSPSTEAAVDTVMAQVFFREAGMLVFDCSTFAFDPKCRKLWGIKGSKPAISVKDANRYYHLFALISERGVESLAVSKVSVTAQMVKLFLFSALRRIKARQGGCLNYRYLWLDNAAVNATSILSQISTAFGLVVVFNIPRYPYTNPIEWWFATVKATFRMLCFGLRDWSLAEVQECLERSIGEPFMNTMMACYSHIIAKYSSGVFK